MSGIESLYERLDEMERRLEERVLHELDHVSAGRGSMFLNRRMTANVEALQFRGVEVGELEDLADEVVALKAQLGVPRSSGVTGILLSYEDLRERPWSLQPDREQTIDLARQHAQELRAAIARRNDRVGIMSGCSVGIYEATCV
jgi:hypothetical protein